MFEIVVWLVVTLATPQDPDGTVVYYHKFPVSADAPEAAGDDCSAAAAPYVRKAVHVNRGDWAMDVTCRIKHADAEPAKGRE